MKDMGFKKHFKAYFTFAKYSGLTLFASPTDFFILFSGKLLALFFGIVWVQSIFAGNKIINGYTQAEMLVYLGIFLVMDRVIQILFYRSLFFVQVYVQSGQWDKIVLYPLNSAFIASFRMTDLNDIVMLIPSLLVLIYAIISGGFKIGIGSFLILITLCLISLLIAYSILLTIAASSFYFTKVENLYLLYRDTANVGRFPPEVFGKSMSILLTFVIPVLSIFALPSKFIIGKLEYDYLLSIICISVLLFIFSILFWNKATLKYTSAGS